MVDRAAAFPKKVLVVEDDEATREVFVRTLVEDGHRVLEAPNGLAGLDVLRRNRDVSTIIVDQGMPVMDGGQFVRVVRGEIDPARSIAVVLVSAYNMSYIEENNPDLYGLVDGFLRKPLDDINDLSMIVNGPLVGLPNPQVQG